MLEINDKGIIVPDLNEIIDDLSSEYRDIYGQDIDLTPSSQDGQRVGLEAQARKDAYDTLAYAIQMHDPLQAVGKWADLIASLSGIKREDGKYTILPDVKITTDRVVNLNSGYIIEKDGNKWILEDGATLLNGVNYLNFRSEFYGEVPLVVGASLEPEQVVFGVKQIESTKTPIMGYLGQSTASMMTKRLRRVARNNLNDREGIEASLLEVDGVVDALVLENNTNITDSNGVPAHSINAIVLGGSDEGVATTIFQKIKGGGCGTSGEVTHTIPYRGADRITNFDRATPKDVMVVVTIVRAKNYTDIDEQPIKDAIAGIDFMIGDDVVAGMLYCFPSDGSFYIKSIKVDGADISPIGIREIANISADNVTVVIE